MSERKGRPLFSPLARFVSRSSSRSFESRVLQSDCQARAERLPRRSQCLVSSNNENRPSGRRFFQRVWILRSAERLNPRREASNAANAKKSVAEFEDILRRKASGNIDQVFGGLSVFRSDAQPAEVEFEEHAADPEAHCASSVTQCASGRPFISFVRCTKNLVSQRKSSQTA